MAADIDTKVEALGILKRHPLLGGIEYEQLRTLVEGSRIVPYQNEQYIFQKGDMGDALYGIIYGSIRISVISPQGKQITLNVLERGQFFGEIALLDDQLRTADAISSGESLLVRIARDSFYRFLERNPRVAISLIRLLCDRLRWVSDNLEDAAFLGAKQRLAKRILILTQTHGKAEGNVLRINLRLSQEKLGQMVGLSRESTNQIISEWRRDDIIAMAGGYIEVLNLQALDAIYAS